MPTEHQEETMKVHTLAATDTQTNIKEVLTQTVQRRFSLRLRRLIGYTALLSLGTMGASASWADNCTGYDAGVTQSAETTDLGHGLKQTSVRSTSMLFSNDSIYNLVGGECAGTVLQTEDGKTQQMGYCARHDKDGDTHSIVFKLTPDQFASARDGAAMKVQYGSNANAISHEWTFGNLDKSLNH